jgi:hypothetical protein
MTNAIEYLREAAVEQLFNMAGFSYCWAQWRKEIIQVAGKSPTALDILKIADSLEKIFSSTNIKGRKQSTLSAGGSAWEGLVCWYLNLCLIGTRAVVVKQNKHLIPGPLGDAFTVCYNLFPSNTESDLVAIIFPDEYEYNIPWNQIVIPGINTTKRNNEFNYLKVINWLCARDYGKLEARIIQCKTNWNDNAQIPMLWDMIYASDGFSRTSITVGNNLSKIKDLKSFTYSFVTVPTNPGVKYTSNSTAVRRVHSLSGGNYWGRGTEIDIAGSLKAFLNRNMGSAVSGGIQKNLISRLPQLKTNFSYFYYP